MTPADVGLIIMGLSTPPAVMSCFLPSPSTAYDKASGQISSGPASMALLRRGELLGSAVAVGIGAGASLAALDTMGPSAAWIFAGVLITLGLFLWEYESAFRRGRRDAEGG